MIYANSENGEKIEATKNSIGFCPSCGEKLIAKCGELKINHWSHIWKKDCDDWYEPETEWHLGWKRLFGKENCEVVIPPHRADIVGNFDVVIELQHSNISIEEIKERESFYKKMIWIVDAHLFSENLFFTKSSDFRIDSNGTKSWGFGGSYYSNEVILDWKRKQKRWLPMYGAEMPVMLDFSNVETKVYHTLPWLIREGKIPDKFGRVKDSLFWMRSFYFESDMDIDPYLIGGNFVAKNRILERYKPKSHLC